MWVPGLSRLGSWWSVSSRTPWRAGLRILCGLFASDRDGNRLGPRPVDRGLFRSHGNKRAGITLCRVAFDRLGPRVLYLFGFCCLGLGYVLASQATSLWQIGVCLGFLIGLGSASIGMIPASALVARWFDKNLATAMAVVSTGLGTGTLAMAPFAQVLIDAVGWRSAYLWMGGAAFLLVLPLSLLPWTRIRAGQIDRGGDRAGIGSTTAATGSLARAIRGRPFWALFFVYLFTSTGVFGVSLQSVAYLVEQGFAPLKAASAFGFNGMLSILGMLVTGTAADRFGTG